MLWVLSSTLHDACAFFTKQALQQLGLLLPTSLLFRALTRLWHMQGDGNQANCETLPMATRAVTFLCRSIR